MLLDCETCFSCDDKEALTLIGVVSQFGREHTCSPQYLSYPKSRLFFAGCARGVEALGNLGIAFLEFSRKRGQLGYVTMMTQSALITFIML